jgi:hypothetical protein
MYAFLRDGDAFLADQDVVAELRAAQAVEAAFASSEKSICGRSRWVKRSPVCTHLAGGGLPIELVLGPLSTDNAMTSLPSVEVTRLFGADKQDTHCPVASCMQLGVQSDVFWCRSCSMSRRQFALAHVKRGAYSLPRGASRGHRLAVGFA